VLWVDDLEFYIRLDDGAPKLFLLLDYCDRCNSSVSSQITSWSNLRNIQENILDYENGKIACGCPTPADGLEEAPEKNICPLLGMAGQNVEVPSLEGRCGLWNRMEAACSFWLMGHKVAFELMEHDRRGE